MNDEDSKISRLDLLSQIDEINDADEASNNFLSSSFLTNIDSQQKKKEAEEEKEADNWFRSMYDSYEDFSLDRHVEIQGDLFNHKKKKKKKKKKDKENDLIDYTKELDPEAALLTNLLVDQNRFTESLQKEYDYIKSRKSSARGVTKQMTDLVENITDARSLSMQLVKEKINLKKTAAELNLKQKKELGGVDTGDINEFAANFLKQTLTNRNQLSTTDRNAPEVSEYNDDGDDLFNDLESSMDDEKRPDEVEKYLKYENSNVKVYVVITNDDVENYEFIAMDQDNQIINDYPMPIHTDISVNRSTNIATDGYGKKYTIIWK